MVTRLNLAEDLHAATEAAAVWDRSDLGRLQAIGKDALDLLNRLSTNQVDPLGPGQLATTVLTTNKGRILDVLTVLRSPEHVLIVTSAGALEKVTAWLEKYTIVEDVTYVDVSSQTAQLTVTGPRSPELLDGAFGREAKGLERDRCAPIVWQGAHLLVARSEPLGGPGYDVLAPAPLGGSLKEHLLAAGKGLGALPAGPEAWEVLRIQKGIPQYGQELTESYNPLEADLAHAVSWTKGCYIGQEVVARLRTYHKVQRYLVRLALAATAPPPPGARLVAEGQDVGVLTSAAVLPGKAEVAALGYVRTAYVRQGLEVQAVPPEGTPVSGRVVWAPELPAEALTPAKLLELLAEREE